jgi:hypothetical protein
VHLDPSLTAQLAGVVLRGLSWHGRRFTIAVGRSATTVTLQSGPPLPVTTPAGRRVVTRGRALRIPTRRPDRVPTADVLRCQAATATTAAPGAPALAAVDGSPATDWMPTASRASVTVPVAARAGALRTATVLWGRSWPPAPGPNIHPPPGPVRVLRPAAYTLLASGDGRHWRVLARKQGGSGTRDVFHFAAVRARYVRLTITRDQSSGSGGSQVTPQLEELTARAGG